MRTDTDLLTLAQWLSPSFPVGAYSYSHGLEAAVQHGAVSDAASVVGWIDAVLRFGSGRSDALFLAAAYRSDSPARLWEVESACRAFAPSKERLMETTLQSEAFCKTVAEVWDLEVAVLGYPVAVGRAARLRGIAQDAAAQFYLHAFLSNLAGAAMRLSVIGQTDGQRLIRDLTPACADIATETQDGDLDRLSGTAFLPDIASMRHETQYSRIFRT